MALPRLRLTATLLACLLLGGGASTLGAADSKYWTLTPYRIRVLLAAQTVSVPSQSFANDLVQHLRERADAAIGPIWDLQVESLQGNQRIKAINGFANDELLEMVEEGSPPADKLMIIVVRETLRGVELKGRECDRLLARVDRPQETSCRQLSAAGDEAFALLCDLFSPIAVFNVDREAGDKATLSVRGSQLPTRAGAPKWFRKGDVLLPVLRRTNREGELAEDGIQVAPWTYLIVGDPEEATSSAEDTQQLDEPELLNSSITSHTKRPFGVRRRGRVEYYAVRLHPRKASTKLRLHAKEQPDLPLSGYQAFVQDGDEDKRTPIGASNTEGLLTIEPGKSAIQMVFIKSGSQVVAKAPIPAGAIDLVEIPLLDERARLEAEAKLSLLREELIDLVARRSILTARIEGMIENKKRKEALALLEKLDGMPGRAQFSQKLNRVQQQSKSDNPTVQARIDKQFRETAAVLGAFLGTDKVRELRAKLSGS